MVTFTSSFGIARLIYFLVSALGFIYFVFSIGYAFSIAGMALTTLILWVMV